MKSNERSGQNMSAGNDSVLVQAGRDVVLGLRSSPPFIRLVRLTIEDNHEEDGLRQKLNIIVKNNGDRTAFLQRGLLVSDANVEIINCMDVNMAHSLSLADWQYDLNIDSSGGSSFVGKHSIAPNEVVNFDVMVGRPSGGINVTVYRAVLRLEFDEGEPLETEAFYLRIAGPTVMQAGYQSQGPSADQWGKCMAKNIRRLDAIGYDYRPNIDAGSVQYVKKVAPELFEVP